MTTTSVDTDSQTQETNEDTDERTRATPEEILGAGLMIAMVIILFIQVISRFVFSSSLSWSEELARYMFIWMIYLCLGSVALRGEHIVIDVLILRMGPRLRRSVLTLALLIAFALNVLVLWTATDIALVFQQLGQTSPALSLPMWLVYAALPVGMLISAVRTVQTGIRLWREDPESVPEVQSTTSEAATVLSDPVLESSSSSLEPQQSRDPSGSENEGDAR
jgi:C4-dicarboxylate transporter DctQ subunit